ncbi:gliding motility protein GldN [Arcticibacter sp. MXS-1]|uniref:type IX secretion system ring protein PorN/GldN n=1 Tax=Arcticibacter sp. MXS-1 TaxID=3341726 RepID=UPI0035A8DDF1
MKNVALLSICLAAGLATQAQEMVSSGSVAQTAAGAAVTQMSVNTDTIPQTDGFFNTNKALEEAIPFSYPDVNRNNIRFYKRVWRDIDITDKNNLVLGVPGKSLIEAIMKDISAGRLTPYEPSDESFTHKLSAKEGQMRFQDSVLVPIFDADGNQIDSKMMLNEFDPQKVTKFRIKEDIFLNKQRGRVETRIIGVAPLMNVTTSDSSATAIGSTPAFWLYFPQLRYTLVKIDISDPDRDLFEMTMDDLFVQRKFASKIVRESSSLGSVSAQDAALDADEAERKIQEYKRNLWKVPASVKVAAGK